MKHHGVMVLAPTIAEAWDDLYYLERAAEVQVLAMSTGRKVLPVDPEIAAATYQQMREGDSESARLHLAAIRRQLDAEEPGIKLGAESACGGGDEDRRARLLDLAHREAASLRVPDGHLVV